jgi:hypothetical protein
MKRFVLLSATVILVVMLGATGWASLRQPIWQVGDEYWGNPWAVATLADAYCGFLIFYFWVAYRERGALARAVWFALIMMLGNIATAAYLLLQVVALRPGEGPEALLLKKREA